MKNFIIIVAFAAFAVWMGSNLINGSGTNSMQTQMNSVGTSNNGRVTTINGW